MEQPAYVAKAVGILQEVAKDLLDGRMELDETTLFTSPRHRVAYEIEQGLVAVRDHGAHDEAVRELLRNMAVFLALSRRDFDSDPEVAGPSFDEGRDLTEEELDIVHRGGFISPNITQMAGELDAAADALEQANTALPAQEALRKKLEGIKAFAGEAVGEELRKLPKQP